MPIVLTVLLWILLVSMVLSIPLSIVTNRRRKPLTDRELAAQVVIQSGFAIALALALL